MKTLCFSIISVACFLFAACDSSKAANNFASSTPAQEIKQMKILLNGKTFSIILADNLSANALVENLPLALSLHDLNANEKYGTLPIQLPSNARPVKRIHAGDVMLFGNDCLVFFYEDFSTSYQYTQIGKITNREAIRFLSSTDSATIKLLP